MKLLAKLYDYFCFPVLVIHELSHIIFGLLSGMTFSYKESYLLHSDKGLRVCLIPNNKRWTLLQLMFVPYAPLVVCISSFFFWAITPYSTIITLYLFLSSPYSLPSQNDRSKIRYMSLYLKYDMDSEVIKRFIRMQHYKDELYYYEPIESNEEELLDGLWSIMNKID